MNDLGLELDSAKKQLRRVFAGLDPVHLLNEIREGQRALSANGERTLGLSKTTRDRRPFEIW